MAENEDDFDWSPTIPFEIYGRDYQGFIKRLVKVIGRNSKTKFINRGKEKNVPYVNICLMTETDGKALEAHMRQDNLYVNAMGPKGGGKPFRFKGVKDFDDDDSTELGYGENYQDLTRDLDNKIYELDYQEFIMSVETLIDEMSATNLDTSNWARRMFIVISAIAEGARNIIVALSYYESITTYKPSTTPWMWISLVINNWDSFSQAAIKFDENLTIKDLTQEERGMLFAKNVKDPTADSYREHLKAVLAKGNVCRAVLKVLCGHMNREASSSR